MNNAELITRVRDIAEHGADWRINAVLNDAADALEAAEQRIAELEKQAEHTDQVDAMNFAMHLKQVARIAELEAQMPKRGEWISVKDRLPEVGDVVLAMGKRHATTGQFQGIGSKPCYWWWKGHTIKEVTHWMPLPDAPEVEG